MMATCAQQTSWFID